MPFAFIARVILAFDSRRSLNNPPTTPSRLFKNLEQYREGLIKLWMNDFGNLGRYRDANAKLAPLSAE